MPVRELDNALNDVRKLLRAMTEKVEVRIDTSLDAWLNNEYDLAESLRHADDEIDELDVQVEQACLEILEKYNPTGVELRFVVGTLRMITQLERMADLARSVAKRVLKHHDAPARPLPEQARPMAELVREMARDVRKAIEAEDADLARKVRKMDPEVDAHNRAVYEWAVGEIAKTPSDAEVYLGVLVQVRALERIGDLCANAAEDVIFVVGGSIVRHTPI